jgi:hypothetical protein
MLVACRLAGQSALEQAPTRSRNNQTALTAFTHSAALALNVGAGGFACPTGVWNSIRSEMNVGGEQCPFGPAEPAARASLGVPQDCGFDGALSGAQVSKARAPGFSSVATPERRSPRFWEGAGFSL